MGRQRLAGFDGSKYLTSQYYPIFSWVSRQQNVLNHISPLSTKFDILIPLSIRLRQFCRYYLTVLGLEGDLSYAPV